MRLSGKVAVITGAAMPEDMDNMDSVRAEQWIETRYAEFMAL